MPTMNQIPFDSLQSLSTILIKTLKVAFYYQQLTDEETRESKKLLWIGARSSSKTSCSFCYNMLLLLSVYVFHTLFGNAEYDVTKSHCDAFIFISCLIPFLPQNHYPNCWLCLHKSEKEVSGHIFPQYSSKKKIFYKN